MQAPSEDIKDTLEAESSLALTLGTDLFIGREPTEPANCVTIYDTPGAAPMLTLKQGEDYYYPSIQIRVRNSDYLTGWNLINDIKILLHGKGPETWNGTLYSSMACLIEPALLTWQSDRAIFVTTFQLQRQ